MIWTYNDDGYLVSVDAPEQADCRMCGTPYRRGITDARPWQQGSPDACPRCGHITLRVPGIRFTNTIIKDDDEDEENTKEKGREGIGTEAKDGKSGDRAAAGGKGSCKELAAVPHAAGSRRRPARCAGMVPALGGH